MPFDAVGKQESLLNTNMKGRKAKSSFWVSIQDKSLNNNDWRANFATKSINVVFGASPSHNAKIEYFRKNIQSH